MCEIVHMPVSMCVCECVYTRTSNRLQALPSKALPSPTKKAGAPTAGVLATVSLCACAGRQAGRGRLGSVVRLSLCGGRGAGVEGCGMHQNMCRPAALMPRWGGKAVPSHPHYLLTEDLPHSSLSLASGPTPGFATILPCGLGQTVSLRV